MKIELLGLCKLKALFSEHADPMQARVNQVFPKCRHKLGHASSCESNTPHVPTQAWSCKLVRKIKYPLIPYVPTQVWPCKLVRNQILPKCQHKLGTPSNRAMHPSSMVRLRATLFQFLLHLVGLAQGLDRRGLRDFQPLEKRFTKTGEALAMRMKVKRLDVNIVILLLIDHHTANLVPAAVSRPVSAHSLHRQLGQD